ncbi:MAG: hypothetical protein F6K17_05785 [Okeania sp. SIO3C4]|nr:hypothetical protein [Okeania sp. SIO3C4]
MLKAEGKKRLKGIRFFITDPSEHDITCVRSHKSEVRSYFCGDLSKLPKTRSPFSGGVARSNPV